jgi:SAM-dependent methyltransferase
MRRETIELLRSPETGNALSLRVFAEDAGHVTEGLLTDTATGTWFRIEDGIAFLEPVPLRRIPSYAAFAAKHRLDASQTTAPGEADPTALAQISFFAQGHDLYETEVVDSPFYRILDEMTVGRWIDQTLHAGERVLEVGCGSGRQTLMLLKRGLDVVGVDLSEEMVRSAARKVAAQGFAGKCDFITAAAESLPLIDAQFDAAVIYGSLHHFSDPPRVLRDSGAMVRPGGTFYLLEPHKSSVRFIFDWLMRKMPLWEEEAAPDGLFTAAQFTRWLEAAGFAVKISYSTYLPPHMYYATGGAAGRLILSGSDAIFNALPGVRRLAGVIIASGVRR